LLFFTSFLSFYFCTPCPLYRCSLIQFFSSQNPFHPKLYNINTIEITLLYSNHIFTKNKPLFHLFFSLSFNSFFLQDFHHNFPYCMDCMAEAVDSRSCSADDTPVADNAAGNGWAGIVDNLGRNVAENVVGTVADNAGFACKDSTLRTHHRANNCTRGHWAVVGTAVVADNLWSFHHLNTVHSEAGTWAVGRTESSAAAVVY
jgi:hypothetical protein